jgi:hypothetical protein
MNKAKLPAFCIMLLMMVTIVWAAPVPDTGLTKCYDVAGNVITCPSPGDPLYGQDANYNIHPMSYTKLNSSGDILPDTAGDWKMVQDNVTGLIWEKKTNMDGIKNYNDPHDADNIYTWYDSNPITNGGDAGEWGDGKNTENFIKALNDARYGGFSDWRLPTIKELAYIVNYSIPYLGSTINADYFPDTVASFYWSSPTCTSSTNYAWGVNFFNGRDLIDNKSDSVHVYAVRGGQSVSLGILVTGSFDSRSGASIDNADGYTDNGDGTVTDTSTGLMWQQTASSNKMTWEDALAYCEALNLGGHIDWRLPTVKELISLIDYSRYNPAINTNYFPDTVASFFWSSTINANSTNNAWCINFYNGSTSGAWGLGFDGGGVGKSVRAVRGGQSGPLGNLVISPLSRTVTKDAGSTTFSVSNTGDGTMPWTAAVTAGGDWLSITSGASGTDAGVITCAYTAYTGTASRTGTIRVTAPGATASPMDVTVVQGANTTACTATIGSNYSLHLPLIIDLTALSGKPSYSADFAYKNDPAFPTMILFRLTNAVIQKETFTCSASTLSSDFTIHIPDVLLPDGITRMWLDIEYIAWLSTNGNVYFKVSKHGVISK